ncbi:unnamed protein product [Urochloa humidicola]
MRARKQQEGDRRSRPHPSPRHARPRPPSSRRWRGLLHPLSTCSRINPKLRRMDPAEVPEGGPTLGPKKLQRRLKKHYNI